MEGGSGRRIVRRIGNEGEGKWVFEQEEGGEVRTGEVGRCEAVRERSRTGVK